MKPETRRVAYVTLDNFFEERQGGTSLEALLSRTSDFERCLKRHGREWVRPSADEAFVVCSTAAVTGPETLDLDWAERLREDIRVSISLDSSVGIASTRLAARISSRMARPRGLLVLLPGYETQFTATVPLAELDELRPAQAAALHRHGIGTLGELARLEANEARSLLGPQATRLMQLVRGTEGWRGGSRGSGLERALGALCLRAARRLLELGCGARGLELELVYHDSVSLKRYSLLPRPISAHSELAVTARDLLGSFPRRDRQVVELSLTFTALAPRWGQLPLFSRPPVRDVRVRLGRCSDPLDREGGPSVRRRVSRLWPGSP